MIVGHCPPKKILLSVENVPDDNESVVLSAATTMCRQGARKGDTVTGIEKKQDGCILVSFLLPMPSVPDASCSFHGCRFIGMKALLIFLQSSNFLLKGWTSTSLILACVCIITFLHRITSPPPPSPPNDFHVIVMGAGVSGICMGKRLHEMGIR